MCLCVTYVTEWNVPLELKCELFVSAAGALLVLGANEDVVEEEQVAELPVSLAQLHDERILDQVTLHLPLTPSSSPLHQHLGSERGERGRRSGLRSSSCRMVVVVVDKGLDDAQGVLQRLVVGVAGGGVFDEVLQAQTVLLHSRHRLVQEVFQAERLALLVLLLLAAASGLDRT